MAFNTIYNVSRWRSALTYSKNDIVLKATDIEGGAIPKEIKYFYSLQDSNKNHQPTPSLNDAYWGGFTRAVGKRRVPNFLWVPSYNASINHAPRVSRVSFGNGYEQRTQDGIFSSFINLSVSFDMRGEKEAAAILHFLRTRKGVESFAMPYLPPIYRNVGAAGTGGDQAQTKLFVCPSFNTVMNFHNNYTIKANFNQTNH